MKAKFILVLLSLSVFGGNAGVVASAEAPKEIEELEPLDYQELEFKENTDYLHDKQKVEMKNTLPEKQFDIDFDGGKQLPNVGDTSFLFEDGERGGKSTVAAMASEMGLFNEEVKVRETNVVETSAMNNAQASESSFGRTVIFVGLIIVGLIMLFVFILPRLIHQPVPQNRK
jgi:hypothetical protein